MLAAIITTILSSRSCALTRSAMTSRSRRSRTRGPPSAPRMGFLPVGAPRRPYDLPDLLAREGTPALSLEAGAVLRLLYFRAVTHVYNQTKSPDRLAVQSIY